MRWAHYVGGNYTPEKFVAEARTSGITRRVSASQIRGMSFGDTVILLYYNDGDPYAFGDFVITKISLKSGIAGAVTQQLVAEGRAIQTSNAPIAVSRECGEFIQAGCWMVLASLDEIVDKAERLSRETGEELWFMVGGNLGRVYDPAIKVIPKINFFRGFAKAREGGLLDVQISDDAIKHNHVVAITNYQKI